MPDAERRRSVAEPYAELEMFAPKEYSGVLMELAQSRRGEYVDLKILNERRCSIRYTMPLAERTLILTLTLTLSLTRYTIPLAELITDFFDAMKSRSKARSSVVVVGIEVRR